ncbi:hypothetical protein [Ligilactobacillus acidipiscis]|uniref:hypothetical protein n=1 Tax=Ligilactobacillus acidipiscis TaxID=89059 RepID=UPI0023FA3520|nr:hypothetical protein [Ligilactobacillus acidipiscis]WEV57024.1 hypothetical protein OZX66_00340 [Ligilactobacillus acidipiscis]
MAGTDKVIKKLEQFAIQVTFARAGLAKISDPQTKNQTNQHHHRAGFNAWDYRSKNLHKR